MKRMRALLLVAVVFFAPSLVAQEEMPLVVGKLLEQIEMMSRQLVELGEMGVRLGGAEMERAFDEQMEHFERMRDELAGMEERVREEHGEEHGREHEGDERYEWGSLGRSLKLTFEKKGGGGAVSLSCAANHFSFSRHNEKGTSEHEEGASTETRSVVSLNVEGEIFPTDKPGQYLVHVHWEEEHRENSGEGAEDGGAENQSEFSMVFSGSAMVKLGERVTLLEDGPRAIFLVVTEGSVSVK